MTLYFEIIVSPQAILRNNTKRSSVHFTYVVPNQASALTQSGWGTFPSPSGPLRLSFYSHTHLPPRCLFLSPDFCWKILTQRCIHSSTPSFTYLMNMYWISICQALMIQKYAKNRCDWDSQSSRWGSHEPNTRKVSNVTSITIKQ